MQRRLSFVASCLLAIFLLCFAYTISIAQLQGLRAVAIDFNDGKNLNNVQRVVEDETGLIWISRWVGPLTDLEISENYLFTYDGHRLEPAHPEVTELLDNDIRLQGKSATGDLIFSGHGVRYVDPENFLIERIYELSDPSLIKKYGNGKIVHVVEGEDDQIWAILAYKATPRFTKAILLKSNSENKLEQVRWLNAQDPWVDSRLIYTDKKLIFSDVSHVYIQHIGTNRTDTIDLHLQKEQRIRSLAINNYGALYVQVGNTPQRYFGQKNTQFGLFQIELKTKSVTSVHIENTSSFTTAFEIFCEDRYVWIIGDGFLLYRLNSETGDIVSFGSEILDKLPQYESYTNPVHHWYKDSSGAYWICGYQGLIRFTTVPDNVTFFMNGKGVNQECMGDFCSIRGMCAGEKDEVYISYENGIKRLDLNTEIIHEIDLDLTYDQKLGAFDISYFNDNIFWGDKIINPKNGKTEILLPNKPSPRVIHTIDTVGQILWLMENGNLKKLYKYNLQSRTMSEINVGLPEYKEMQYEIHRLQYDYSNNFIAISSKPFLGLIDTSGNVISDFTEVTNAHRFGGPAMYLEKSSTLWFMRNLNFGLRKIDVETGDFKIFYFEDDATPEVLNGDVFFIQPYQDKLFLGTWKGLAIFDRKTEQIRFFEEEWITRDFEYNRTSHLVLGAKLFAGTTKGLIVFNPEISQRNFKKNRELRVHLRGLQYQDKKKGIVRIPAALLEENKIELSPDHRLLTIQYSISDYRNSQFLLYSHWMEGYEESYSALSPNSEVNYSYLPPGKYKLHLKGGINQNFRDQSELILEIIVKQHWYLTPIAYSIYFVLIIGIFLIAYRINFRRQKEKTEIEQLKKLDEYKSEFFTNISHEFRTPLTMILGAADEIESAYDKRSIIKRNGNKLLKFINDILNLSKLESGNLSLNLAQIEIISFLKFLTESYQPLAHNHDQEIKFSCTKDQFYLDTDPEKIQTIIENLISNAIKYGPKGSIIEVRLKSLDSNIEIEVEDQGEGLTKEDGNRIFEKFYQIESKNSTVGSGVGLAICKQMALLLKGDISYNTKSSSGGFFSLHLPVTRNEEKIDWTKITNHLTVSTDDVPQVRTDKRINSNAEYTVLIVEDSDEIRDYIGRCLAPFYKTEFATNGATGLEKALEIVPDIIISDVMMPEMDGYELCNSLKEHPGTSHIPIVLLTARSDFDSKLQGLEEGADAYLSKPFKKEELLLVLNNLIKLRNQFQTYFKNLSLGVDRPAAPREYRFINDLKQVIDDNLQDEQFGIAELCEQMSISRMQLHRKLKALCNTSTTEFIHQYRINKAKDLLLDSSLNVSEVAYQVGYSDPSYFSRIFTKTVGQSPTDYRR